MVVIGIDAHKRTHTAVAVDVSGVERGVRTVLATSAGHLELIRWADELDSERRFAVEDCTSPEGSNGTCCAPVRRSSGCRPS